MEFSDRTTRRRVVALAAVLALKAVPVRAQTPILVECAYFRSGLLQISPDCPLLFPPGGAFIAEAPLHLSLPQLDDDADDLAAIEEAEALRLERLDAKRARKDAKNTKQRARKDAKKAKKQARRV